MDGERGKSFFSSYFSRCLSAECEMISVIEFYSGTEKNKKNETVFAYFGNRASRGGLIERFASARFYLLWQMMFCFWPLHHFSGKKCFSFDSWLLHFRHLDILVVKVVLKNRLTPRSHSWQCLLWKLKYKSSTFCSGKLIRYSAMSSVEKIANEHWADSAGYERVKKCFYIVFVIKPIASVIALSLYFNHFSLLLLLFNLNWTGKKCAFQRTVSLVDIIKIDKIFAKKLMSDFWQMSKFSIN